MKKLLCLVLSLMLLMLCPTMAEPTVMKKLTSPEGDCSFEVPQSYFALAAGDQNVIDVYSSDMESIINFTAMSAELSMDDIVILKTEMDSATVDEYLALGVAKEDITTMDIQKIGDYRWYAVQVILYGTNVQSMLTVVNDVQYVLTFVDVPDKVAKDVLHSFKISTPTSAVATTTDVETLGQRNALRSAKSYLQYSAFSRKGLIRQLEYEKYSNADAVYAVDHCGANWYEQAVKSAKSYLNYSAFSYSGLVKQLEYEGFTHEQAVHGADCCGADWYEQAVKCAKSYLEYSSFSRQRLIDQLEYEGFTNAQAVYGVTGVGY